MTALASILVAVTAALVAWCRRDSAARIDAVARPRAVGSSSRDRRGGDAGVPLDRLVTEVATMLRAGAPPASAWARVGVLADMSGVPDAQALRARCADGAAQGWARVLARSARAPSPDRHVVGVVAGCRVAADVGASLAPVLDGVAAAVVRAREGEARRAAALAGPRATARLLGWLPVGGLGVAVLMGAGPGSSGAGQGVTTVAIGAGALLMLAGRAWTRRLVREAAGARG